MRQGLGLPYGLAPVNPSLGLEYSGPYTGATLAEAIAKAFAEFPKEFRAQTVVVHLVVAGVGLLYWFKDGVEDKDLVPLQVGGAVDMTAYIGAAPIYADEAAATAANLLPNTMYKTPTGELRYKLPAGAVGDTYGEAGYSDHNFSL